MNWDNYHYILLFRFYVFSMKLDCTCYNKIMNTMECPNILCNLNKIKYIITLILNRVKRTQIIDSGLIYFICDSFYNSKKVNQ